MAAYLSAAKKASIKARMRAANKADVVILLDEAALAVAQGVTDATTAAAAAVTAGLLDGGNIDARIDALILAGNQSNPAGGTYTMASGLVSANVTAMKMANIAKLNQDISAAYAEAEVQAISDKVDAILLALKTKGFMVADA